jgi:arginyl-tRNA synthetase
MQALNKKIELPEKSYKGKDLVEVAQQLVDKYGDKFINQEFAEVKDIFKKESIEILLQEIKNDLKSMNIEMDV